MKSEIKRYFDSVPAERRRQLLQLHELIVEAAPQVALDLSYRMPTYRLGESWVAIANQKHYISLYTCGAHHLEKFKRLHPSIKSGKGCLNFKPDSALPLADIKEVILHALLNPGHG